LNIILKKKKYWY